MAKPRCACAWHLLGMRVEECDSLMNSCTPTFQPDMKYSKRVCKEWKEQNICRASLARTWTTWCTYLSLFPWEADNLQKILPEP